MGSYPVLHAARGKQIHYTGTCHLSAGNLSWGSASRGGFKQGREPYQNPRRGSRTGARLFLGSQMARPAGGRKGQCPGTGDRDLQGGLVSVRLSVSDSGLLHVGISPLVKLAELFSA